MRKDAATHHVLPRAGAGGVRALEAGPHVDEHAAVAVEVRRAFAVAAAAEARERDLLRDRLVTLGRQPEEPPRVENARERREREREGQDAVRGSARGRRE